MNHSPYLPEHLSAGFDSIFASLKETEALIKLQSIEADKRNIEADKRNAEFDKRRAETEAYFKQRNIEADKRRAEFEALMKQQSIEAEKRNAEAAIRIKKLEELMGGWANNHGSFAEEYFFNSFEADKKNFFGEHFNEIMKNVKPKGKNLHDEYDIVMYNDFYVAIVETKFTARKNNIPKILKKAETFRILCPDYKDFKIYLGLASLSFNDETEQECIDQGIAVIKQVGETVVINDAHLKVY